MASTKENFTGLVVFSGTGASFDSQKKSGKLVFGSITDDTKNGKKIYANGIEMDIPDKTTVEGEITALQTIVDSKQDTLVSGVNIKTINNQSILGSGNITIGGGGGGDGTVVQNPLTSSGNYPILLKNSTSTTQEQAQVNFNSNVTVNPGTGLVKCTKIGFGNSADVANISANGMQLALSGQYVNIGQGSDGVRICGTNTSNAVIIGGDATVNAKGYKELSGGDNLIVWTTDGGKLQIDQIQDWMVHGDGIKITRGAISGEIDVSSRIAGSTTVASVSAVPTSYKHVLANISANATMSFASLPLDGYDVNIIIHNTGSSTISVSLPNSGSYACTSYNTIYIGGGLYGEVNVINIGGKGYVRGVSSI